MYLTIVEDKTQDNIYKRFEEFQADTQTVYYGVHSPLTDMAWMVLRDSCYNLGKYGSAEFSTELQTRNYRISDFVSYELVFTKQNRFSCRLAKVIRVCMLHVFSVVIREQKLKTIVSTATVTS